MGSLTIRKLDDDLKKKLRVRAANHGVSMEEEARRLLHRVLDETAAQKPKPSVESILAFGKRPDVPIDLKKISDDMWDESFD